MHLLWASIGIYQVFSLPLSRFPLPLYWICGEVMRALYTSATMPLASLAFAASERGLPEADAAELTAAANGTLGQPSHHAMLTGQY